MVLVGLYYFSSNFTEGMIGRRYSNLASIVNQEQGTISGRAKIMALDLEIFRNNFLMGVGPGAAGDLRWNMDLE